MFDAHYDLLYALLVQKGLRGIDVVEEEIETAFDEPRREQTGSARKGGRKSSAIERYLMGKTCCQLSIPLGFPQLRKHFGTAPLGPFLLRNRIVCAGKAGCNAILTRVRAFANAFDFAPVAAGAHVSDGKPRGMDGAHLSQALLTGVEAAFVDIM